MIGRLVFKILFVLVLKLCPEGASAEKLSEILIIILYFHVPYCFIFLQIHE